MFNIFTPSFLIAFVCLTCIMFYPELSKKNPSFVASLLMPLFIVCIFAVFQEPIYCEGLSFEELQELQDAYIRADDRAQVLQGYIMEQESLILELQQDPEATELDISAAKAELDDYHNDLSIEQRRMAVIQQRMQNGESLSGSSVSGQKRSSEAEGSNKRSR